MKAKTMRRLLAILEEDLRPISKSERNTRMSRISRNLKGTKAPLPQVGYFLFIANGLHSFVDIPSMLYLVIINFKTYSQIHISHLC